MNLLVTGGCGFIGQTLCRLLLGHGHRLTVLDDFSSGRPGALSGLGVRVVQGDVRQPSTWGHLLAGLDGLVHLAAATGIQESIADPGHDFDVNTHGTFQVLRACQQAGLGRVVFASTNALLGQQPPPMRETVVPMPLAPYAASKLAGEAYCQAFRHSYGLSTVVLRFANAYGPHSHKGSVVHRFIRAALAGRPLTVTATAQTRDFVHVQDLAAAVAGALTAANPSPIYQIGSGQPTTVRALAELVAGATGAPVVTEPPRPAEVRHSFVNTARAQAELGYAPGIGLAQGVADTVRWFAQGGPDDWPLL